MVGLLAHAITNSLDGGSKVHKAFFVDFSIAVNTLPRSQILDRLSNLGAPSMVAFLFHQQATPNMPKWSVIFLPAQKRRCFSESRSSFLSILLAY